MRNRSVRVRERLGEQRSKADTEVSKRVRHVLEKYNDRLTLENTRFVERYENGELHFLLEFSAGLVPKNYVVYFERAFEGVYTQYPRVRLRRFREQLRIQARQMYSQISSGNGDRESVFINDAEFVKLPEPNACPTFVWFNRADLIYGILPQSLYLSRCSGFVFRGAVEDRERDFAVSAIGSTPKEANQVVQGGSEVLDSIASYSWDEQRDWIDVRDKIRRSLLGIETGPDFVGVCFKEPSDRSIHLTDMLIGPFDFDLD